MDSTLQPSAKAACSSPSDTLLGPCVPGTGERLGLMTTATVGEGGWVDLDEPILVRAGEAFLVVPEQGPPAEQHSELVRFRAQPETEVDQPG